MIYDHYIFGEFVKSSEPLNNKDINDIFFEGDRRLGKIQEVPIEKIVDILSSLSDLWLDPEYSLRKIAVNRMPGIVGYSSRMVEAAIDALFENMSRENLYKIIRGHIGRPQYLDRFEYDSSFDGYFTAQPLGMLLHVSPGNVFVGGADSLMYGFLSKNINLLKISSADPVFPLLFARSLKDTDEKGFISNSFSILNFSGSDEEITSLMKQKCDGIVVIGGEEAVQSYRKDLPLGTRLIEYGPKYSFSIITSAGFNESKPEEVYEKCAMDVVMWEQRACSSPQVIYVEESIYNQFCSDFPEYLERINNEYPHGEITFDEKVEVLKARETARILEAEGKAILRCSPRSMKWTVICEKSPVFRVSPLNRTIFVKPYQSWADILAQLVNIKDYLQSVALLATDHQMKLLSKALARLGVSRISSIGRISRGKPGAPHDFDFSLRKLVKWVSIEGMEKRFDLGDTVAPSKPSLSRWDRLQDLLKFAVGHSDFYRQHTGNIGKIRDYEDFEKIPFLSKEHIYENTPPVGTAMLTAPLEQAYIFASGGSTGQPKFNYYSFREMDRISSILADIYRIAGINRQDRVANLFMAGYLWTSFIVVNHALEKIGCVSLPISGNADLDLIIHYITIFRPNVVVGLPSMIIQLAEEIERRELNITIEKILYGGEHFSHEAIRYLKRTVGAKFIRSAGYASVDAGPVGYQCPECKDGVHHLLYEYMFFETIEPETKRSVKIGEVGEIVVSNFHRRLMPIIRYRTGDLGRVLPYSCTCLHRTPLFELLGRCDDVLRVGAMSVYPQKIGEALGRFRELSAIFQLQAEYGELKEILTVKVEALNDDVDLKELSRKAYDALLEHDSELALVVREGWLEDFRVEVIPSGSIERNPRTGKIRRVIDKRR